MLGTKQDSTVIYDHPSKIFIGVRFVLLGFDPINAQKVRSKLVNGGGVDVFQYGPNCTHVIVGNVIYDDPICVAARTEGKVLVTGLWVDHSHDVCMPVDPTFVIYRPLRDLGGIPGSKSLIVCLTGYQRQDRDDIMTLVGLMGATFSKPLVANKVTHLICYKFEGEKYELAKKMKKIKLVNHRWLEDCLRAWEILPEANYDKSGYELEMMEAEAKDSEEEEEAAAQEIDKNQYGEKKVSVSPQNLHIGAVRAHPSPQSKEDVSRNLLGRSASIGLSSAGNYNDAVLTTAEETLPVQTTNLQDIHKKHPEVLGSLDSRTLVVVTCRTPTSVKSGNDSTSNSGNAKRSPQSDAAKLSTKSYSRKTPRKNTLSMASNLSSFPKVDMDKFNLSARFDFSSPRAEKSKDGTDSGCVKTPLKETDSCHEGKESVMLPEKRKISVTYGSSKSQKLSHHPKACISESPLMVNRTGGSEPAVLINNGLDENATPGTKQTSPDNIAIANFSSFNRKSLQKPAVDAVITENRQENNPEAPQTSSIGLKNMILDSGPVDKDVRNRAENAVNEVAKPHKEQQDEQVPSPGTKGLERQKSKSPMDFSKGKNVDSVSKPLRRKVIAKRSLSSRAKLGLGSTKNKKGSIYLNETALQSDAMISLTTGAAETADEEEMFVNSGKLEMIPPTVKVDNALLMETNDVEKSGSLVDNKTGSMDDETEAPEDKEEHEFEAGDGKEKTEEVDLTDKMNLVMENQSEGVQPITIKADASSFRACGPTKTSHEDENGAEHEEAVCGRKNEPNKSTTNQDGGREKLSKCKKRPLSKTLGKSVHSTLERRKSKEGVHEDESKSTKNNEAVAKEKENNMPSPSLTGKPKRAVSSNKLENSLELEKENRPVIGDQKVSHGKQWGGKVASKSCRPPMKMDLKAASVADRDSVPAERVLKVKVEPAWFILSGHKLQRKEFQQVIRRLRGRVCRDSHQWSYQATHFIVPDPIRRTEKLFAAVASGRWILKTDYLTASNQAGRFLVEEPYEWHKSGLSEDGAINLEAPRKWRLLRERTSHGAFYGMRVVIYGECIAPPLDTLKRVIRAGDGTILATSPPYTRFLKSGVDFAIVSPGMPRVDMWVQEFLRHEIPCVLADYLVEYVCKPGYSLERHVQYNTHAWAERSFANLMSRAEEVVDPKTPEDRKIIDLPCQVCGSTDRGEVMLICGNESGSMGCGVGTHIDCCNPPLEEVPDEDWFCKKCSESINSLNRGKSTKKRISSKGK